MRGRLFRQFRLCSVSTRAPQSVLCGPAKRVPRWSVGTPLRTVWSSLASVSIPIHRNFRMSLIISPEARCSGVPSMTTCLSMTTRFWSPPLMNLLPISKFLRPAPVMRRTFGLSSNWKIAVRAPSLDGRRTIAFAVCCRQKPCGCRQQAYQLMTCSLRPPLPIEICYVTERVNKIRNKIAIHPLYARARRMSKHIKTVCLSLGDNHRFIIIEFSRSLD